MRKALRIWSPFTRNSSEMRITPKSQAYSTSSPDAITRKFCPVLFTNRPCISAKVTVVVASITGVLFFRKSSVLNLFGMKKRKKSRLSTMAITMKAAIATKVPSIQ